MEIMIKVMRSEMRIYFFASYFFPNGFNFSSIMLSNIKICFIVHLIVFAVGNSLGYSPISMQKQAFRYIHSIYASSSNLFIGKIICSESIVIASKLEMPQKQPEKSQKPMK